MKNSERNVNVLHFIAFVALIVVAILQVFSVLSHFGVLSVTGFLPNFLETIKNFCVCLVVGILAYNFVAGKSRGVKITFWVCLAIIIIGTILIWINIKK